MLDLIILIHFHFHFIRMYICWSQYMQPKTHTHTKAISQLKLAFGLISVITSLSYICILYVLGFIYVQIVRKVLQSKWFIWYLRRILLLLPKTFLSCSFRSSLFHLIFNIASTHIELSCVPKTTQKSLHYELIIGSKVNCLLNRIDFWEGVRLNIILQWYQVAPQVIRIRTRKDRTTRNGNP